MSGDPLTYGRPSFFADIDGHWHLLGPVSMSLITLSDPASSAGSRTAPKGAAAREQERHDGEPGS